MNFGNARQISITPGIRIKRKCIQVPSKSYKVTPGKFYTIDKFSLFQKGSLRVESCDTGRAVWYPCTLFFESKEEWIEAVTKYQAKDSFERAVDTIGAKK